MFLDSDDWYSKDALETAYHEAVRFNTDMTFFQMINYNDGEVYENDWFDLKTFDESFEDRVFGPDETPGSIFDLSVGVCQKIYNRKFLKSIDAQFPEGIFFEDMPFFYYVYLKSRRISIIKRHLQILMRIFIENGWYEQYKFDLLAYKVNGPRFALRDLPDDLKPHMFDLIKEDYEQIRHSQYFDDFTNQLGPVKRKFFLDVLKSKDYYEFANSSN